MEGKNIICLQLLVDDKNFSGLEKKCKIQMENPRKLFLVFKVEVSIHTLKDILIQGSVIN